MKLRLGTLLFLFLSNTAFAQDSVKDVAGLGNVTCELAISDMDGTGFAVDQLRLSFAQWAWGYWSGLNAANQNANKPSRDLSIFQSGRDVASALLSECLNRPTERVFQSADTIYERMKLK